MVTNLVPTIVCVQCIFWVSLGASHSLLTNSSGTRSIEAQTLINIEVQSLLLVVDLLAVYHPPPIK